MARPYSEGRLQYFPLDCVMNDAMKLLEAEFGLTAFAVVVKLWQKIYAGRGYYCEWTREVALVFAHECGLGANVVSEIVAAAFKRGIFDKGMYDKYGILTSDGIQKRYFEAVKRRKRVEADERFLLVTLAKGGARADDNGVDAGNNAADADDNSQSKEESKGKNEKENICDKESMPPSDGAYARGKTEELLKMHPNVALSADEAERLIAETGSYITAELYIKKLSRFISQKNAHVHDHFGTMLKWYNEDREAAAKRRQEAEEKQKNEEKPQKRYDYSTMRKADREYLKRLKYTDV